MTKILTVVEPDNPHKIHKYAKAIGEYLIEDVEEAFEALDIHVEGEIVELITDYLEHGQNYWYDEKLCFELIEIREYSGLQYKSKR